MPEVELSSGVVIRFPDDLRVSARTSVTPVADRKITLPTGPIPVWPANSGPRFGEDLVAAMLDQGLVVVEEIQLEPQVISPAIRTISLTPSAQQSVGIEANLAETEDAVLLSEQDGIYTWHVPLAAAGLTPEGQVRGGHSTGKTLNFEIKLHPVDTRPAGLSRNFLTDLAVGGVRAWVLKFAAHTVTEKAMQYLERSARTGFVSVAGQDPAKWQFSASPDGCKLPAGRTGRILLLIHGTFSSTIGSFGALTGTPWGREFLQAAEDCYDCIIGYDHYTLRETPLENAASLLHLLEQFVPSGTQIDVITHSRGGLVFRSLSEMVLPSSAWQPNIGRVIMVASPNAGTLLAEPANWKVLINLYTNLAVGACRLLALMPQAAAVSSILKELVSSLGEFMKYFAQDAAGADGVPGLDAMRTSSNFVNELNETQPGQPAAGALALYAVTSEFAPSLSGSEGEPTELPKRLLMVSMGALMDELMKEPNDLVVNTKSMTEVDISVGGFITDEFKFGATGKVYHTTYFIRPETVNALTRWLRLEPPVTIATPVAETRSRGITVAGADIPALVDTDISLLNGADLPANAVSALKASASSYAVIRRMAAGETYYYAYKSEELLNMLTNQNALTNLSDGLGLHEWMGSRQLAVGKLNEVKEDSGVETSNRGVVLVDNMPVGVVPSVSDFVPNHELPAIAYSIAAPFAGTPQASVVRRIMPTFGGARVTRGGAPTAPFPVVSLVSPVAEGSALPPELTTVPLQFQAEVPAEVQVGKECSVVVTISREQIAAAAAGSVSDSSKEGRADPGRKLLIQVFPRAQFSIEDDRQEVDVPLPGTPGICYFDLKATDVGAGEIVVVARQGHTPICTLILKPTIVPTTAAAQGRLHAEAKSDGVVDFNPPLHQLRISDRTNGNEMRYRFELFSQSLSLLKEFESNVIRSDPAEYVNGVYTSIEDRWRSTKGDEDDFAAEMRAFGSGLFKDLFPAELQKILWEHRDEIRNILVISTEPFIPWEMVLIKNPEITGMGQDSRFLAEMGLVRWLYDAGWPPEKVRIRSGSARYVIPKYPVEQYVLPEAQEETAFLEKVFAATPVEPQPGPVREILMSGDFDLLHFACHAEAEGKTVSKGRILLEGRIENVGQTPNYIPATMDAVTVSAYASLQTNRPLIVLNACQAGRAGYSLTSTGGFAQSFLKAGASAFVGALWSVGDKPARAFTEEFYTALRDGEPLSVAAVRARKKTKDETGATWLAYVVYAHPNAKLV